MRCLTLHRKLKMRIEIHEKAPKSGRRKTDLAGGWRFRLGVTQGCADVSGGRSKQKCIGIKWIWDIRIYMYCSYFLRADVLRKKHASLVLYRDGESPVACSLLNKALMKLENGVIIFSKVDIKISIVRDNTP
jgi:hypothetical protein